MKKCIIFVVIFLMSVALFGCENVTKSNRPEEMIIGTWENQDGFLTFSNNGIFACNFEGAVLGNAEYSLLENTLTLKWMADGESISVNYEIILLTEDTLSLRNGYNNITYVLSKKK